MKEELCVLKSHSLILPPSYFILGLVSGPIIRRAIQGDKCGARTL